MLVLSSDFFPACYFTYNDIGLLYSVTESIPDNGRVLSFIFLANTGQNQFTFLLYFGHIVRIWDL